MNGRGRLLAVALVLLVSSSGTVVAEPGTELVYEGETLTLESGPGQRVHGHTNLSAGTTLSIRIRSSASAANPFIMTSTATVDERGEFGTTFDLSDVPAGTEFQVVVHHEGDELADAKGQVVECSANCEAPSPTPAPTPTSVPTSEPPSGETLALQSIVATDQGETARIHVGMGDADAATVTIGGPDVNYEITATVRDGNGDGRVAFLFNTTAAGHDGRTLSVATDADDLSVHESSETTLSDRQRWLDAGSYGLALYRGTNTDEEVDVGTLVVQETSASETASDWTRTPTPEEAREFGFKRNIFTTRQGQTTVLRVHLADADAGTIEVGDPGGNVSLTAIVRDGNGDGRVALLFDTSAVGPGTSTLTVADESDSLSVESVSGSGESLPPGDYDLALHRGRGTDGEPDEVGTLVVNAAMQTADERPAQSTTDSPLSGDIAAGLGALAVGGLFAVAGVAVLLGLVDL